MLFNSYTFLLFFALVFLVYRYAGNWTIKKSFLLLASYVFYAAWNPPFVALLWLSTIVDWYAGKGIERNSANPRKKRRFLYLSLAVNLGMLGFFKYSGFLVDNLNSLLVVAGSPLSFDFPNIILPVGISFYTFQTLSYSIDIYRGNMKAADSFLDYALYVTFFPQLVAGPIVRAIDFIPQCKNAIRVHNDQIGWGLSLFVIGLFAKVVLADSFASPIAELLFNRPGDLGFISAWTGVLAFAVQIFCDFFGYSTCAIGIALCMGFDLPDNFRFPYGAIGFSDFWRRWHISLSSWLRDYLYIPLGGNRLGPTRTHVNLMATMLLGGLWHGASWMFVIWGLMHGLFLVGERWISQTAISRSSLWSSLAGKFFLAGLTFVLVCFTWVFFRAQNMEVALRVCRAMLDVPSLFADLWAALSTGSTQPLADALWMGRLNYVIGCCLGVGLMLSHFAMRSATIETVFAKLSLVSRAFALFAMMLLTYFCFSGDANAFIYFQF